MNSTSVWVLDLDVAYTVCEVLVAAAAVLGNSMVLLAFHRERRLRRRTNYYIVSLAAADLLVGLLGVPFAILASVGLPHNLHACLFTVSLLVVLCTISIFCLVAVSVDRYWAILHPMAYSRNVRTKTAIGIIGVCWVSGALIGLLPLMGWYNRSYREEDACLFTHVMSYDYLVFLYFATIICPALLLAAFYAHIYRVVLKQLRQMSTLNPTPTGANSCRTVGGAGTLRMLAAAQKREVKATQNLSIIVLFFIICWIPLYTINCVVAFCSGCTIPQEATTICIILSHLNSAVNPVLYAYHLKDFRAALKGFFFCGHISEAPIGPVPHQSYAQRALTASIHSLPAATRYALSASPLQRRSTVPALMTTANSSLQSICSVAVEHRKRMITLPEVPSVSDDDSIVRRRSQPVRVGSSGQVNSAYLEAGDEEEDDTDEVFDRTPSVSVVNAPLVRRIESERACASAGSSPIMTRKSDNLRNRRTHSLSSGDSRRNAEASLSNSRSGSSIQASRQLIVDADRSNSKLDHDDRTELSPKTWKFPLMTQKKSCAGGVHKRKKMNHVRSMSDICDSLKRSTSYNKKIRHLRTVSSFLLGTTSSKSLRLRGDGKEKSSNYENGQFISTVDSGVGSTVEINDKKHLHNNGCVVSQNEHQNDLSLS